MATKAAERAREWLQSLPYKCDGYPSCDGDLVGMAHSETCPMLGKEFPTVPELLAAYEAATIERCAQIADKLRNEAVDEHHELRQLGIECLEQCSQAKE